MHHDIYNLLVSLLLFLSMFLFKWFVLVVCVDLTLHVLFFSVLKNSKTIKIEKSPKILITCVVFITCEFGLVPSY